MHLLLLFVLRGSQAEGDAVDIRFFFFKCAFFYVCRMNHPQHDVCVLCVRQPGEAKLTYYLAVRRHSQTHLYYNLVFLSFSVSQKDDLLTDHSAHCDMRNNLGNPECSES